MYLLLGYLHSGIQLAPAVEAAHLQPSVVLSYQAMFERVSGSGCARNPSFRTRIFREIDIFDDLENRSNLDIALFNDVG